MRPRDGPPRLPLHPCSAGELEPVRLPGSRRGRLRTPRRHTGGLVRPPPPGRGEARAGARLEARRACPRRGRMTALRIARDLELPVDAVTQAMAILARRGAGKTY